MKTTPIGSALAGALLGLALLTGCAQGSKSDPAALADKITHAVYANDFDTATTDFDDDLKKSATRSEVGALSDKMHLLGDIKTLTQRTADVDKGRYDYDVTFDHGAMVVQLRIDPSGKVGAYRVVTQ